MLILEESLSPNHSLALQAIRRHGPLTRAEIGLATGLSRSSVHALTSELLAAGLIREAEHRTTQARGRPALSFSYNGDAGYVLAIAFEHDRVSIAVADLTGAIVHETTAGADIGSDADLALEMAAEEAKALLGGTATSARSVVAGAASLPGPVDVRHGTIGSFSILRGWAHADPARRLRELLGVPMLIDNDANMAAYAEAQAGAAVGCKNLLYVKASTGVGAGLLLDGHIYRGSAGMAGEVGHVTVDPAGKICRCGSKGCLETVCGIGGITSALATTHADGITLDQVIELASGGDAAAERALAEAGTALGRAIGEVSNVLNPSLIVLGGELAAAEDLVLDPLRASLRRAAMQVVSRDLEVRTGALGTRAELIGAAALCTAHLHGDVPASLAAPGWQRLEARA